jgi:flavorubredoxin
MAARKIKDNVFFVGAIDWNRRLFDSLIPLPDGTSYNAYFIRGSEKTALIDTVDPAKEEQLIANLEAVDAGSIDYIISNHTEQDHSGWIPKMLELHPKAKVVTNAKCKEFLQDHLLISEERFILIDDGETVSLGDKTLQFIIAPWVHWPETMFTYLVEDRILFPCDFLGSHLAPSQLFVEDIEAFYEGAKRYYAEIMMPFRTNVQKHLRRLKDFEIDIVAPSHGPIHMNPKPIMDAYAEWSSDEVKNVVVLPFVSMHGSTEKMVEYLLEELTKRGIEVKPFDLVKADSGKLAMAIVDAATIVIGTSTVLVGAHPKALYAAALVNALRPKTRFAGIIGSYGWGTRMVDQLKGVLGNLKVEMFDPVVVKGYPKVADLSALDNLADRILEKHREAGLTE